MIILTVALWIALCPFWSAEAWWWNYSKKSTSMEPIVFPRINILYLISAINYAVHRRKFLLSSVTTKSKKRFYAETKLAFFLETQFHFWRLSHVYKIDLLSFCNLFLHFRPRDVIPENSFFHMSSYAREGIHKIMKNKQKIPLRTSRALKWENKTSNLSVSIKKK